MSDPSSKPCEFEVKVLRAIRDRDTTLPWGAAVGQAYEVCLGSGWATRGSDGYLEITERGIAVLAAAESDAVDSVEATR